MSEERWLVELLHRHEVTSRAARLARALTFEAGRASGPQQVFVDTSDMDEEDWPVSLTGPGVQVTVQPGQCWEAADVESLVETALGDNPTL